MTITAEQAARLEQLAAELATAQAARSALYAARQTIPVHIDKALIRARLAHQAYVLSLVEDPPQWKVSHAKLPTHPRQ